MSDEEFARDAEWEAKDLAALKGTLGGCLASAGPMPNS
jgi:hypothetical protein